MTSLGFRNICVCMYAYKCFIIGRHCSNLGTHLYRLAAQARCGGSGLSARLLIQGLQEIRFPTPPSSGGTLKRSHVTG